MKPLSIFFLSLFIMAIAAKSATAQNFTCTRPATCQSLIGYVTVNTTSISSLQNMFNISSLATLLAENSLPNSTSPNGTFPANSTVRIPFPCRCTNGIGISDRIPVYRVVPEDGLYHIAEEVFSGFVTYQQIQAVNNIPNADQIEIGQELWIPLPCSCDVVDGATVVHYGHKVVAGTNLSSIALQFGTTEETLRRINRIENPTDLQAGSILDVPLRAPLSQPPGNSAAAPPPPPPPPPPNSAAALRLGSQLLSLKWLLVHVNMGLLGFGFLL